MQLVVQTGPDVGKVFVLDRPVLVVGRQTDCEIVLSDPQVSRRHIQFELRGEQIYVGDLGSANGSTINGQPLLPGQPRLVQVGDIVRLGGTGLGIQSQPVPNYGPPAYQQPPVPPGYNPTQPPAQGQYGPPPVPLPSYNLNPAQPSAGAYPAQPAANPAYYPAQPPAYAPVPASKPANRNGVLVAGLVAAVIIVLGSIGLLVLNNTNNASDERAVITIMPVLPTTTTVALPTATLARGQSGTNPPPPPPKAAMRPLETTPMQLGAVIYRSD